MKRIRKWFTLITTLVFMLMFSISVFADTTDDNGTGGGSGGAGGSYKYGASASCYGYRCYLLTPEKEIVSDVVDIYGGWFSASEHVIYKGTRLGGGTATKRIKISDGLDIPKPYRFMDKTFVGNGKELRVWMREYNEDEEQNILQVIAYALGEDAVDTFMANEKIYLVMEPITWHGWFTSYDPESYTGIRFYGTFYNYMQFYNEVGVEHGWFTQPIDNNVLGRCLALDRDQEDLGLVAPYTTGLYDYNNLGNQGAGIHLYANEDFGGGNPTEVVVKESQIVKSVDIVSSLNNTKYPNNVAFVDGVHRGNDELTIAEFKNTNDFIGNLKKFTTASKKSAVTRKLETFIEKIGNTTITYETYSGAESEATSSINGNIEIKFRPYIKMRYDTETTKDNEIFILGEYDRSLWVKEHAEVTYSKSSKPNMAVNSYQWSTHATAVSNKGVSSVLPGGATLSISIPANQRQTVSIMSYQIVFDGNGKTQVEKTSSTDILQYTKENALKAHKEYVESAIIGLQGMSVAQWENKDDTESAFKGIKVYSGGSILALSNGSSKASTDSKYYFRDTVGEGNSGCLDIQEGDTTTNYYTFSSDTEGNILMNGTVILTKTQDTSSLTGIAATINSKTFVVSNLLLAIERNTGNDNECPWALEDGHWYNEAFDGITIAVSETKVLTGFINPYERTSVFDPQLTPKSNGKGDMLSDYFSCAFKMNDYSLAYNVKNQIGTFKGKAVYMSNMDMLYYSKDFYTSNITVQDLK